MAPVAARRLYGMLGLPHREEARLRSVRWLFVAVYGAASALFLATAAILVAFAAASLLAGVRAETGPVARLEAVLEAVALLTISVASLELGQTIIEEEIVRQAHMSAPTRVRRFLSRFMVVIVVSLSIEALVAVFQLLHRDPSKLPQAAAIALAAAVLLAGWGIFVKMNREAEELEPEAMEKAKSEDEKVD